MIIVDFFEQIDENNIIEIIINLIIISSYPEQNKFIKK